jgi:hypothetical protein
MCPLFRGTRVMLIGGRAVEVAVAPTNFIDALATMDVGYMGAPFVWGATKATMDLQTMNYADSGGPFVVYRK